MTLVCRRTNKIPYFFSFWLEYWNKWNWLKIKNEGKKLWLAQTIRLQVMYQNHLYFFYCISCCWCFLVYALNFLLPRSSNRKSNRLKKNLKFTCNANNFWECKKWLERVNQLKVVIAAIRQKFKYIYFIRYIYLTC